MSSPPPRFTLTSPAFAAREAIPARYTCDREDVSPPVAWAGAPPGTASLVLIVRDQDAHDFLHWLAYEIQGAPTGSLPAAIPRSAATPKQGLNDFGRIGYGGPCPPSGTHHYVFSLSAVDRSLGLGGGRKLVQVEMAMSGHVLAMTELVGTYKRH